MIPQFNTNEKLERIIDDWDFFEDKVIRRFSTFREHGDNVYGVRSRSISPEGVIVDPKKGRVNNFYQLGPSGPEEVLRRPLTPFVVPSGNPHHIPHDFGYWHVNDMDELYVHIPNSGEGQNGYSLVCMGNPGSGERDGFAWYCENCWSLLFMRDYTTGDDGFTSTFWKVERAAVEEYNSDPRNQYCGDCGHVNQLGYTWNPAKDAPEAAAARKVW
ncbi:hypothetical protein [Amycolatopsis sp. NPDC051371]|jgi:hypothetical protein|uniref:hypothetical protein n=1 Tax=Amycolatopsis sp. NPDC051371 TaxID=3155800 RepID=UPI00343479A9